MSAILFREFMQIPGYKLAEPIGKGAMATVYLAQQRSLNRSVAIKVLDVALVDDPFIQSQFQQESQLVARLNHPNIIQVIDQGNIIADDGSIGSPYFVMQYVKSVSLDAVLQRKDVVLTRKIDIVMQICKALSYAHRNGVVHRDIKPANILVDYDGHVRVVDFGIAGYFEQLSDHHVIMGTPAYMAPEQAVVGQSVTAQSDLYSLGVLMHELFYGVHPDADVSKVSLTKDLSVLVSQCLQRDPDLRPKTADQIRQALLLILQGRHLSDDRWDTEKHDDAIPDSYKLLDVLKEDKYGATYLVSEPKKQRLLIVKKQQLAYEGDAYRVNKLLTRMKHPNIARVFGVAKNDRVFITVVDYVSGGSLKERLSQAFPLMHWLLLARQICDALGFAHQNKIVHGNLRPSNLLLYGPAQLQLTDFGFESHDDNERDWYQPPAEEISALSDIYSAGAVLFHLLVGEPVNVVVGFIANVEKLTVLPEPLQLVITKMLCLDKEYRYQSILQVKADLQAFSDDQQTVIVQPQCSTTDNYTEPEVLAAKVRKLWLGSLLLIVVLTLLGAEFFWLANKGVLGVNMAEVASKTAVMVRSLWQDLFGVFF